MEIVVDGVASGAKSGEPFYVTADDRHVVTVRRGEQSTDLELIVGAGKSHEARVVLEEKKGARKEVVIAGAALAGASAIAGAVLLGVGFSAKADAAKLRNETVAAYGAAACASGTLQECKRQSDLLGQGTTLTNAGMWAVIGAGVVGAGTAAYVLATRSKSPPTVQAGAVVTPNGGGAVVRWSF